MQLSMFEPENTGRMKAISVRQPAANKIASGEKTIEIRTWSTHYRGDLLIVSSASPKIEPAGFALCIARLADVRPMTKEDEAAACCAWDPSHIAWVLTDIRPIAPFPVKGRLGIYEVQMPVNGAGEETSNVQRSTSNVQGSTMNHQP